MEAPTLIGLGIGFAVIGLIFGLLSKYKPDFALFQKYTEKQFCRTQGTLAMCVVFGVVLALQGAFLLMGTEEGENPAAVMMGLGAALAIICFVLYVLSIRKPDLAIFGHAEGKKLWRSQGVYIGAASFGLLFFLLGLLAKPWTL